MPGRDANKDSTWHFSLPLGHPETFYFYRILEKVAKTFRLAGADFIDLLLSHSTIHIVILIIPADADGEAGHFFVAVLVILGFTRSPHRCPGIEDDQVPLTGTLGG